MTRQQEIESLRARLAKAERARKRKTAAMISARLQYLMTRQLKHEARHDGP